MTSKYVRWTLILAARGTDARVYPWGNAWEPGRANVGLAQAEHWRAGIADAWPLLQVTPASTEDLGLRPVGRYPQGASPYRILDLVGNVEEWVADWYDGAGYLQVWHLYITATISGIFQGFQWPAYSVAITLMLPKEQYARANGMLELAGTPRRSLRRSWRGL